MTLSRFSRVLIVDDSAVVRKVVCKMMAAIGYDNVHEAQDGRSALRMIDEQRFALVISDWNMTPVNGMELLKTLRAARPHAPYRSS